MKKNSERNNSFHWHRRYWRLLVWCCWGMMISSCYEPVDGCLDINASNFNAMADIPCDDGCCTYPSLSLTVNHLMGDQNLSYDSVFYSVGFLDSIRLVRITWLASDFRLWGADSTLVVRDDVQASNLSGESVTLTDDFALIDFNKGRSYPIGTFQTSGDFDSLTFRLGLVDSINTLDPLTFPSDHPLSIQEDTMWREDQAYALARIQLVSQANNTDTLDYFIPAMGNGVENLFSLPLNIPFGQNATIRLDIDYLKWLEGIDFVTIGGEEEKVVEEIVSNLPNSISLTE